MTGGIGRFAGRKKSGATPASSQQTQPHENQNAPETQTNDFSSTSFDDAAMFGDSFNTNFGAGAEDLSSFGFNDANFNTETDFNMESTNAGFNREPASTDNNPSIFDANETIDNSRSNFIQGNPSGEKGSSITGNATTRATDGSGSKPPFLHGKTTVGKENVSMPAPGSLAGNQGSVTQESVEKAAAAPGFSMFSNKDSSNQTHEAAAIAAPNDMEGGAEKVVAAPGHSMFSNKRSSNQTHEGIIAAPNDMEGGAENVAAAAPPNSMGGQPQGSNHAFRGFRESASGGADAGYIETPPPRQSILSNMVGAGHASGLEKTPPKNAFASITPESQIREASANQFQALETPVPQEPINTPSPRNGGGAWGFSTFAEMQSEDIVAPGKTQANMASRQHAAGTYQDDTVRVTPVAESNQPGVQEVQPASAQDESGLTPHTDNSEESFDELFSRFLVDLRDSTDLTEQGDIDLLDREVELEHAYSLALQYKAEMLDFLEELYEMETSAKELIKATQDGLD